MCFFGDSFILPWQRHLKGWEGGGVGGEAKRGIFQQCVTKSGLLMCIAVLRRGVFVGNGQTH